MQLVTDVYFWKMCNDFREDCFLFSYAVVKISGEDIQYHGCSYRDSPPGGVDGKHSILHLRLPEHPRSEPWVWRQGKIPHADHICKLFRYIVVAGVLLLIIIISSFSSSPLSYYHYYCYYYYYYH